MSSSSSSPSFSASASSSSFYSSFSLPFFSLFLFFVFYAYLICYSLIVLRINYIDSYCHPRLQLFKYPHYANCMSFTIIESSKFAIIFLPSISGRRRGKGPGLVNRCLPFNTEFCPNTPYFTAGFPNLLGHKNPHAAEVQIARLTPLMRTGCSSRLQDFLCGVHFPECLEREIVVPCRSLCFEVLGACAETLARLNFQWPPRLRCENFPANGDCFGKGKEGEFVFKF